MRVFSIVARLSGRGLRGARALSSMSGSLAEEPRSDYGTDYHVPVMQAEVMEWLVTDPDGLYVDATLGGGGHSSALLAATRGARVVGVDQDSAAIAVATARIGSNDRFSTVKANFDVGIAQAVRSSGGRRPPLADGVLLDLGVSSHQLDEGERGFSLRFDGPLDMRMDPATLLTAHDIVNGYSERDLTACIRAGTDEPRASRISKAIATARPLESTHALRDVVAAAMPYKKGVYGLQDEIYRRKAVTRVFQAFRVRVNDEFGALERALLSLPRLVRPGGRVVVLSYHSLEDRRVKRVLRSGTLQGDAAKDHFGNQLTPWSPVVRGALTPQQEELDRNPRARSVKMRVAERTIWDPDSDAAKHLLALNLFS